MRRLITTRLLFHVFTVIPLMFLLAQQVQASTGTLIFSDEFTGSSLNTSVWTVEDGDSPTPVSVTKRYNVTVGGGYLHLFARHEPGSSSNAGPRDYTTGSMRSHPAFYFLYGRVEVRAKLIATMGTNSLPFWLNSGPNKSSPNFFSGFQEIDPLEVLGNAPTTGYLSVHYTRPAGSPDEYTGCSGQALGFDVTQAFHIYTIEWSAAGVTWFIDGVERCHLSSDSFHTPDIPLSLIFDTEVGIPGYPGSPDGSSVWPQEQLVDYIRVYAGSEGMDPPPPSPPPTDR